MSDKAQIQVLNWNTTQWTDYTKMIKNVAFSLAEQISKTAFEKYTEVLIDKTNGTLLFGKSRITDQWLPMDTLRGYTD